MVNAEPSLLADLFEISRPRMIGSTLVVRAPRSSRNFTKASRSPGGMLTKK